MPQCPVLERSVVPELSLVHEPVSVRCPPRKLRVLRSILSRLVVAEGFTLEDVKNLLGHSSIALTSNTYGHVLEQRQSQVASGMDAVLGGVRT